MSEYQNMVADLYSAAVRGHGILLGQIKAARSRGEWINDVQAKAVHYIPRRSLHVQLDVSYGVVRRKDPALCITSMVVGCSSISRPWTARRLRDEAVVKGAKTVAKVLAQPEVFAHEVDRLVVLAEQTSHITKLRLGLFERVSNVPNPEALGVLIEKQGLPNDFDAMDEQHIATIHRCINDMLGGRMVTS